MRTFRFTIPAQFAALLMLIGLYRGVYAEEIDAVVKKIDSQLQTQWKAENITPTGTVDDAGYLRRAYLDLVGTLPSPDMVVKFTADTSTSKREKLIEELLADKRYGTRWADYWDVVLLGRVTESAFVDRGAVHRWLEEKWRSNAAWDKIVQELVTAEGMSTSGAGYGEKAEMPAKETNPAVNWFLRYGQSLPELSAATSRVFLGVQLQCAQCHDHKTEKWKKEDFQRFTAFYTKTWPIVQQNYSAMSKGRVGLIPMELKDRIIAPPTGGKLEEFFGSYQEYIGFTPRTLDGKSITTWGSRRQALAKWITARENPWFAPAFVNRMWGELLGTGFVEPIDDFRAGNPALMPATLELLANDFRDHGYDIQRLLKVITRTRAYQSQCRNVESNQLRSAYWSRYPLKPLSIQVLFDSVLAATGAGPTLDKESHGHLDLIRGSFVRQFVIQMGTDDMAESDAQSESIARALLQMNGVLFSGSVQTGNKLALDEIWKASTDDAVRIEQLYLRTLARQPTAEETEVWKRFVNEKREVVSSPGPISKTPYRVTGLSALMTSPEIRNAPADADFRQLMKHARTGPDFAAMGKRITNLVELGLYVKSLQEFASEAPFQSLAENGGGTTAKAQAYEDLFWALLNSSEFLNNH